MCYSPVDNHNFEFNAMHNGRVYYVLEDKAESDVYLDSKEIEEVQVPEADYSHHQYS